MTAVVLDSNLTILLVVGLTSRELIGRHRRLKAYTDADFDCLINLISGYSPIVVTPNTLTETSNLCHQIPEPARTRIADAFGAFVDLSTEEYVPSKTAIRHDQFSRLGLTDAALLDRMTSSRLLLTADHDLFVAAKQ
jgi:hypothetical protein